MNTAKAIRIALVDDHPAVLGQTVQLLARQFEVVGAFEHGDDLLRLAAREPLDVLVLDVTLPEYSGIELAVRLRKAGCVAKIVFLSVHVDPDYVREAFEAGASGYVVKARLASDLILAIKNALNGRTFISPCPELKEVA